MSDFELWYALLDNGTLTIGFAFFCLTGTLTHLALKIRLQNRFLQTFLRLVIIMAALGTILLTTPVMTGKAYATVAMKIAGRPFAPAQQLQQADRYFSKAVACGYWNNSFLRDYSVNLIRLGQGKQAVDMFSAGPWQAETDPELLVPFSRALLAAGEFARAIEIAGRAMSVADEFTRFWAIRTIAEAHIAAGKNEDAAQFLENCLAEIADTATQELLKKRIIQIRQGKKWLETP